MTREGRERRGWLTTSPQKGVLAVMGKLVVQAQEVPGGTSWGDEDYRATEKAMRVAMEHYRSAREYCVSAEFDWEKAKGEE